jgi:non-specific serine/threonine protein kinase
MVTIERRAFGEQLRRYRMAAGLTQAMLAERAGLSERGIQDLERGVRAVPHAETVRRLSDALGLLDQDRAALQAAASRHGSVPTGGKSHNLPNELSSFVGRDDTVASVHRLLSTASLVTLTGPGGIGKSRLAVRVAIEVLPAYPDGVRLVELAPLSDPRLVPQSVATILGAREQANVALMQTLGQVIGNGRVLLVLDNCEHVIQACADLAEALLRACRNLRVLATSRERLGVVGEHIVPVPPLVFPDPNRVFGSMRDLQPYPAVQLFVDRARAVVPSFALTQNNAAATAKVCACLDGVPLALELAAARVPVLTVEQIAARLDGHFGLLTGGNRTALPRQRTLRATFDWSHDLLSEAERVLLRRFAAFAGGCSLEAAEAVCAGELVQPDAVLSLLGGLVDKSLVLAEAKDGEVRYRLLETIRQYAQERLGDAKEANGVCHRHANWYLKFAERAAPQLKGREQRLWLARLEAEHDNMRAALAWALVHDEGDLALRLVAALAWFWLLRGHLAEGRRAIDQAVDKSARLGVSHTLAQALHGAGFLAWDDGDQNVARARMEHSLAVARSIEDTLDTFYAYIGLGMVADMERDMAAFHAWEQQVRELFDKVDDRWAQALCLMGIGIARREFGDMAGARARLSESAEIFRGVGDEWYSAAPLYFLGIIAGDEGDELTAAALFQQALAIWRNVGDRTRMALALALLGGLALRREETELAGVRFRESLGMAQEVGNVQYTAWALGGLAATTASRGYPEDAARMLGAADAFLEGVGVFTLPANRVEYDRATRALRSRLGDPAIASAWQAGHALAPDRAIAEALVFDKN